MTFDFVTDLRYVTLRHNSAGMQYQIMGKKQLCCYRTKERFGEKVSLLYHPELLWIFQNKDPAYNSGSPATSVLQK